LAQLKHFTALYVEDEAGIRTRIASTLRYYFGTVLEASDGEEGLDLYYEQRPDIVLSDIEMPHESGIAMVKAIREIDRDIPIVMVTAYSNEEYLLELINLNISHYILKPVNSTNLLEGIHKALGKRLVDRLVLAGELFFDLHRGELIYRDTIIPLRKRDKQFLRLLHRNAHHVTTYSQIEEHLWIDKPMTKGALKTFIKELRATLPIDIIENIPLEGYRLKPA
jgi:DNA-binding response OmpR family regulator